MRTIAEGILASACIGLALLSGAACADVADPLGAGVGSTTTPPMTSTPAPTSTPRPTPTAPVTTPARPTTGTPVPDATPSPPPPATPSPPGFVGTVGRIEATIRARIEPTSWRAGCPVGLEDLRYLVVSYWTFEGTVATGELVVAATWAEPLVGVFRQLFEARYPIERIALIDEYGGNDGASMRADNTSGFNCREVAGRPGVWSNHAFGTAIDLNPLYNPYISGSTIDPPEGAAYADRTIEVVGMIQPGDAAVRAFGSIGWIWGGTWTSKKDYQHFSADGR